MSKTHFKSFFLVVTTLLLTIQLKSQDFHLSQFEAFPMYINPALTGMRMDGDWNYRINANYKEQGTYLGVPYQTVALGWDIPLDNRFSFGQYIIDNQGANSYFNTLNFMLSGSYHITKPSADNHNQLSMGLQLGLMQSNMNSGSFTYDAQYDPLSTTGFNQNIPSGEAFLRTTVQSVDANFGILYKYVPEDKKFVPFLGAALYHIVNPYTSFTGQSSSTPQRISIYGGCYWTMSEDLRLFPKFLFMTQANVTELNIGADLYYTIQKTDYEPFISLNYRNDDAYIFGCGLKRKTYSFKLSYDMNSSYLRTYSLGKGGVEFSFIYTGKKANKPAERVIPRF